VLFDPAVVRRLGAELLERRAEAFSRLLAAAPAAVNEADVGNDLAFGLLVVQLPEERKRSSKVRECRVVVATTGHGKRKAVQGQCLSSLVAQLADDLERRAVVINRCPNISTPPFGCPARVQASGLPPAAGSASARPRPRTSELPESGARAGREPRDAGPRDLWPRAPKTRQRHRHDAKDQSGADNEHEEGAGSQKNEPRKAERREEPEQEQREPADGENTAAEARPFRRPRAPGAHECSEFLVSESHVHPLSGRTAVIRRVLLPSSLGRSCADARGPG